MAFPSLARLLRMEPTAPPAAPAARRTAEPTACLALRGPVPKVPRAPGYRQTHVEDERLACRPPPARSVDADNPPAHVRLQALVQKSLGMGRVTLPWFLVGYILPVIAMKAVTVSIMNVHPVLIAVPCVLAADQRMMRVIHKLIIGMGWLQNFCILWLPEMHHALIIPVFCVCIIGFSRDRNHFFSRYVPQNDNVLGWARGLVQDLLRLPNPVRDFLVGIQWLAGFYVLCNTGLTTLRRCFTLDQQRIPVAEVAATALGLTLSLATMSYWLSSVVWVEDMSCFLGLLNLALMSCHHGLHCLYSVRGVWTRGLEGTDMDVSRQLVTAHFLCIYLVMNLDPSVKQMNCYQQWSVWVAHGNFLLLLAFLFRQDIQGACQTLFMPAPEPARRSWW
eukprot:g2384.t1